MGDAMDLIHAGLDPLVNSDGVEWEGGWNPHYSVDVNDKTRREFAQNDLMTWSQWKREGRQVIKGSKAIRVNGAPHFSYTQTMKLKEEQEKYCSYGGWSERGYQVKKGEKSVRVNGAVMFSFEQVVKSNPAGN